MTDQEHDVEDLIAALRDDLPSRDDERRVRARLATAGVIVGSVTTLAEVGSAAASAATGNTFMSGGAVASGAIVNGSAVASGAVASGAVASGAAGTGAGLSLATGSIAAPAAQASGLSLVLAKVAGL